MAQLEACGEDATSFEKAQQAGEKGEPRLGLRIFRTIA
jgi:hypothetical protein